MEAFFERLVFRAATIDELLSDAFEQLPGQKSDSELAARRLAAWCRSSASGDWSLFARRLGRDGLSIDGVLARFATIRRNAARPVPTWIDDAVWICEASQTATRTVSKPFAPQAESCAFDDLLEPVVRDAEARLWSDVGGRVDPAVGERARASLRRALVVDLSDLAAPAMYERFAKARKDDADLIVHADGAHSRSTARYQDFVSEMQAGECVACSTPSPSCCD